VVPVIYKQKRNWFGYQDPGGVNVPKATKTLTWHFNAPMVHDFGQLIRITFTMWRKDLIMSISICTKQSKIY
jgi:hypothetical protein